MSFIDQMSNLRATLEDTKKKTAVAVKQTKKDTHRLRHEAQGLVKDFAARQKANARMLREELKGATNELKSKVKKIRGDNVRGQRELRREFAQARDVFWGKQRVEERKRPEEKKKKKEP